MRFLQLLLCFSSRIFPVNGPKSVGNSESSWKGDLGDLFAQFRKSAGYLLALWCSFFPGITVAQIPLDVLHHAFSSEPEHRRFAFDRIPGSSPGHGNSINAMAQDSLGFIWVGTNNGLHRYDGYRYTTFLNNPADSTSLSFDEVGCLYVDRSGTLWVGSGGLNRFDHETETFSRIRLDTNTVAEPGTQAITALLEDRAGNLWVGTHGGLFRLDPTTGHFHRFQHREDDPKSLSNDRVHSIYEDRQGTLWVGTGSPTNLQVVPEGGGLNRFDPATATFTRYLHNPNDENSLIDNHVLTIYEDSRGTFWVGTWGDGLHTMDRREGTFERHRYNLHDPSRLSRPFSEPWGMNSGIEFIVEDHSGALWIGAFQGGLLHYEPKMGTVTRFKTDPNDLYSLGSAYIRAIMESHDGVIWIGTWDGLFRVVPSRPDFPHYDLGTAVHNFHEDTSGIFWLGTLDKGLIRLDPANGEHTVFNNSVLGDDHVQAIYETQDGVLWIGTASGGLSALDRQTGRFKIYRPDPLDTTSIRDVDIHFVYEDRNGGIWTGGHGYGLERLDRRTDRFTHYRNNPNDPHSLSDNSVSRAFPVEDETGALWIGTWGGGLNRFDPRTQTFAHFRHDPRDPNSLSGDIVNALYIDGEQMLWVGTDTGGLDRLDTRSGVITHFTRENSGLPDNQILGLVKDERGNFWIRTGTGLAWMDPKVDTVRAYGAQHGLRENRAWGGFKSRSGKIFFGDSYGMTGFFPDEILSISPNSYPPQVVLTGFDLRDRTEATSGSYNVHSKLWERDEIKLAHDQNIFSFAIVALHYADPEHNTVLYRLEGYDDEWRDAVGQRTAGYYKVPPGRYVFRVKAANSDGIWNEEGASIRVVVRPPLWRTIWAYLLYGLLFVSALILAGRRYRARLIREQRERTLRLEIEHAREIEQAYHELEQTHAHLKTTQTQLIQQEKLASLGQLTAGIAHEIKNPLNFVNNFSSVVLDLARESREELRSGHVEDAEHLLSDLVISAEKIEEHGKRADGIVRSMLLHARGAHGERQSVDLNTLLDQSVNLAYHSQRAQVPDFDCIIEKDFDPSVGSIEMIPQEIGRVFLNLLGNAFYAVHEKATKFDGQYGPRVKVSTSRKDNQVEIRVEDNGPGIPEEISSKVFEPFFTTKPTGQGTGLGLSLAYEIVTEGHGGILDVESEAGTSTVFIMTLPYKKVALSEKEQISSVVGSRG